MLFNENAPGAYGTIDLPATDNTSGGSCSGNTIPGGTSPNIKAMLGDTLAAGQLVVGGCLSVKSGAAQPSADVINNLSGSLNADLQPLGNGLYQVISQSWDDTNHLPPRLLFVPIVDTVPGGNGSTTVKQFAWFYATSATAATPSPSTASTSQSKTTSPADPSPTSLAHAAKSSPPPSPANPTPPLIAEEPIAEPIPGTDRGRQASHQTPVSTCWPRPNGSDSRGPRHARPRLRLQSAAATRHRRQQVVARAANFRRRRLRLLSGRRSAGSDLPSATARRCPNH